MESPTNYPLDPLVSIKQNRFDQAVKALEEKKALLEKAYEKLYDVTQQRDEVLSHRGAKLQQLRDGLDAGVSTDKIESMRVYLKWVETRLAEKEKGVVAQQKEVDLAQNQVDLATDLLFQRKKDLEKLSMHRKEWDKEAHSMAEQREGNEMDEQGAQQFEKRKRETR